MDPIRPAVLNYDWGSRTALPEMCEFLSPSPRPIAELWFGANKRASSVCSDGRTLDERIAADPVSELGEHVYKAHGPNLPFLVKLLAVERPLSLQAHPSLEQAHEGFARENAAGIPLDSPERNFRDANHKPEVIVALSEFKALVGFRPIDEIVDLFWALGPTCLAPYLGALSRHPTGEDLRAILTSLLTMLPEDLETIVPQVLSAADRAIANDYGFRANAAQTIQNIAKSCPSDAGVLVALLLNPITLSPGQALFVAPRQLHSYLSGVGLEVMANSDNVLRGGLTSKHIDAHALLQVLDFQPVDDPVIQIQNSGLSVADMYPCPSADFKLARTDLTNGELVSHEPSGPEILICTSGELHLQEGSTMQHLQSGQAVWFPASTTSVLLAAPSDATVFSVGVGGSGMM